MSNNKLQKSKSLDGAPLKSDENVDGKLDASEKKLIEMAVFASSRAYAPYSKFKVGAALELADGETILGCNVENASYGLTNCAERTAIFSAIAQGKTHFVKMAIFVDIDDFVSPCGACRQVLFEFAKDMKIIMVNRKKNTKVTSVGELLPMAFSESELNSTDRV
ncbi:MAG: cytidine deaminase [Candidatus Riflebacteria bacterium]|nr:cytidine deaminase [Candidatus Riflebacteria bacterium]